MTGYPMLTFTSSPSTWTAYVFTGRTAGSTTDTTYIALEPTVISASVTARRVQA